MTDQNNAAQPGLTDDQIDALRVRNDGVKDPLAEWERGSKRYRRAFARLVESALLSKLRAEGVQAGDERAAFEAEFPPPGGTKWDGTEYVVDSEYVNSYRVNTFIGQWRAWQARAALASAPVADEWAADMAEAFQTAKDDRAMFPASTVRRMWELKERYRLALASAPVAGEARPAGWQNALRIVELPEVDEALANFCDDSTKENAVGLVLAVLGAAPQASEAVNAAMAAEYQRWIDYYHQGRDYDSFLKECVFMSAALSAQPGAQKEQSDA